MYIQITNDMKKTTEKKSMFPKGFWSKKNKPTQNSLIMFFVYLSHRQEDWNEKKGRCPIGVQKTREYFGVDYGIECMLTWGINYNCKNSQTSDGRHYSMSLAYHDSLGMVGQGYKFSNLKVVC